MADGAGMTTAAANANVVPTINLAVLLPAASRAEHDRDANASMVGGKDYLNNRYFDVSYYYALNAISLPCFQVEHLLHI